MTLDRKLGRVSEQFQLIPPDEGLSEKDTIDFSFGNPDTANVDVELVSSILASINSQQLGYAMDQGSELDRQIVSEHLNKFRGYDVSADQIIITSGAIDAINLVARAFLDRGDIVLIENPTYFRVAYTLRTFGVELVPLPYTNTEIDIFKLRQLLESMSLVNRRPKMMYLNPNYQNPTGRTLSERNRVELLSLSKQYDFLILEDDVYSDLYFYSPPPESFFAHRKFENYSVIQVGSVSKILFPSLRFGWIIIPENIARQVSSLKSDAGTSPILTYATCKLLNVIDWNERFDKLRTLYYSKFKCFRDAINQLPTGLISWNDPQGGFFVWIDLDETIDLERFLEHSKKLQVKFMLGKHCLIHQDSNSKAIRIAYSQLTHKEITLGAQKLISAIMSSLI